MRVNYMAAVAAASVLSVGLITGCGPSADTPDPCAGATEEVDPCAADPCAADPCAADPCAADPCAADPCAADPCA
ncbi:MAG: hypothetical protein AAFW84_23670, partial [Cyanobacteria bacterium J06635_15]